MQQDVGEKVMAGVEILNEYVVASKWAFNYWWALGFLVLALMIGVMVCISEKQAPLMILFLALGVIMTSYLVI